MMARAKADVRRSAIEYIKQHPRCSSKDIHDALHGSVGYATVKRIIGLLLDEELISATGRGKATRYEISVSCNIVFPVNLEQYFQKETDEREIKRNFDHHLIRETLSGVTLFNKAELSRLNALQGEFRQRVSGLPEAEYKMEFERLAIDLSWKSSQIEGNTYSLLETDRLLRDRETAAGKTKDEATMLLNHKAALDFVLEHPDCVERLTVTVIEDIHSILIKDLDVSRNIRNRRVGISGTNYRPLDNEFQIREAMQDMCAAVNRRENIFEKALLVLVLISYIQPFADGNKRTSRIIGNAILMHHGYCPVSFRSVQAIDYKKAMLLFYEQNNLSAFKKIFMDQYEFAVNTYF